MIDPFLVCCFRYRLSNIMKQHGKAKTFIRFHRFHCPDAVFSNCIAVMGIVLRCLHTTVKFRKDDLRNPKLISRPDPSRIGSA